MWAGQQWYEILGRRYRVASQDLALLDQLNRALEAFAVSGRGARMADTYCVAAGDELHTFRDCIELPSGPTTQHALSTLLADLNQRAVAAYGGFSVHSGVARHKNRILAIPVESGGGKSTLTAALVLAGFSYLSDEGLCVEYDTGIVTPYPKPISLAPRSRSALGLGDRSTNGSVFEVAYSMSELGGRLGEPGPLTDIMFPTYSEHLEPEIRPIARSAAQARLLKLSFNHYKHPEKAFRLSSDLVRSADCSEFTYSDPLKAARFLKDHLSS